MKPIKPPQGIGQKPQQSAVNQLLAGDLKEGQSILLVERTPGTGLGGGELIWFPNSTAEPDGGGIFPVADKPTGRFHRASHLLKAFTPEDFGAIGDDVHNDYPAFIALGKAVTKARGGTVTCRKDAKYYYGEYIDINRPEGQPNDPWRDIPRFWGFDGLVFDLNGATISSYRGGHRTMGNKLFTGAENIEWWDSPIDNVSGLTFAYGRGLQLRGGGGKLDGQARTWTRWSIPPVSYRADGYPQGGAHLNEPYHQGVNIWGVDGYTITDLDVTDFMTDGLFIGHSEVYGPSGPPERVTNATRILAHNGLLISVDSYGNRRQGMSPIGARQLTAINCKFRDTGHTGQIDSSTGRYIEDAYGWHEPGAGVDIEPSTWPTNDNVNYRVPETTGDISFINCQLTNNMNGPFVCTYSAKIHGNIILSGCTLDGRHDWFPDSYIIMAAGVTMRDCDIYLPPNGFLWQDHDTHKTEANLKAVLDGNRIFITREFGYHNAAKPIPLSIRNNRITYPNNPLPAGYTSVYFLDRGPNGAMGIGGMNNVELTDNHFMVPYTHLNDKNYGDAVALLEGNMKISGNTWELVGTRPNDLGQYVTWQIQYHTDLGGGNKRFDNRPSGERYISGIGASADGDWLVSTPAGYRAKAAYTYAELQTTYLPFGLAGEIPKGATDLVMGMVRGQFRVTDIVANWGDGFQPGVTAKIEVFVDNVLKASAQWATGEDFVKTKTGLPFTLGVDASNQSVRVRLTYTGTATTYEMSNLSGYLALEALN